MNGSGLNEGEHVRNLQKYLRLIANEKGEIPAVVPDGIYGAQTRDAVAAYQQKEGLPVTGEADKETWDRIVAEHDDILRRKAPPRHTRLFPGTDLAFVENDGSILLIPLQAVLYVIATYFPHLGVVEVNGTHSRNNVEVVKKLQEIYGMPQDGRIDKKFWNYTSGLYESQVTGRKRNF